MFLLIQIFVILWSVFSHLLPIFAQEKLKGKDTEIEEMKTLGSRRQETIMQLEQQLASSRVELNEKEKRLHDILQAEVHCLGLTTDKIQFMFSLSYVHMLLCSMCRL